MVAAVLSNGENLTRLIAPKPLLMRTAQTAQLRLGGIIGCEFQHIPFSRKTLTTPEMLELYSQLRCETCTRKGLIITSHEHLMLYKLGGWKHLADGKLDEAGKIIGLP
jgi:hypothetical protein